MHIGAELQHLFVVQDGLGRRKTALLEGIRRVKDGDEDVDMLPRQRGGSSGPVLRILTNGPMFRNFIHRPVLAIVISVLILFVGAGHPAIAHRSVPGDRAHHGEHLRLVPRLQRGRPHQVAPSSSWRRHQRVQGMRHMASDATSAGKAPSA